MHFPCCYKSHYSMLIIVVCMYRENSPTIRTLDLFCKLNPLGICQGSFLFMHVFDVQHFTHELYYRLSLVESCCRNCNDKINLPIKLIHMFRDILLLCNNFHSGRCLYQYTSTWISIAVYSELPESC